MWSYPSQVRVGGCAVYASIVHSIHDSGHARASTTAPVTIGYYIRREREREREGERERGGEREREREGGEERAQNDTSSFTTTMHQQHKQEDPKHPNHTAHFNKKIQEFCVTEIKSTLYTWLGMFWHINKVYSTNG